MAGRGTDIKIDPQMIRHENCALKDPDPNREVCPYFNELQCHENVPCGLHIIGTERHESRRIDRQLRGRSGRQGDPGSSRFCSVPIAWAVSWIASVSKRARLSPTRW